MTPGKASQILKVTHHKQQRKKERDKAGVSHVVIFWILPDGLLAFGVPYTAGEKYGDFINTPDGHYETWGKLTKVSGKLPEDYTSYPRGRIVYRITDQKFLVYLNKKRLNNARIKNSIIREFQLPADRVEFIHDHHYEKWIVGDTAGVSGTTGHLFYTKKYPLFFLLA